MFYVVVKKTTKSVRILFFRKPKASDIDISSTKCTERWWHPSKEFFDGLGGRNPSQRGKRSLIGERNIRSDAIDGILLPFWEPSLLHVFQLVENMDSASRMISVLDMGASTFDTREAHFVIFAPILGFHCAKMSSLSRDVTTSSTQTTPSTQSLIFPREATRNECENRLRKIIAFEASTHGHYCSTAHRASVRIHQLTWRHTTLK